VVVCLATNIFDHSKAVKEVMQAGISVAASQGTLEALGIAGNRRAMALTALQGCSPVDDNSIQVFPFPINHDAIEPFGFVIRDCDGDYLLFVTDTSHIKQRFAMKFSIIAIECSYDKDILQQRVDSGDINEEVAKRLLTSHMEKRETMRYLSEFCDLSKCGEIHLLHMSGDHIVKEQTKTEFEKKFFIETRIK